MEKQNKSLHKYIKAISRDLNLNLQKNLQKKRMMKRIETNNQRKRIKRFSIKTQSLSPVILQMI